MVPQDLNPPSDTQTQNRWADWATAILIAPRRVFMKPRRVRILPWAWLALAGVANLGWLIAIGWATVAFALWLFD